MLPEKSPGQGSLIVAALIVLGIVFAGHWIISYVNTSNPWSIIPWYGVAAVLIIVFGIVFGNLRRRGG
jgi:FtsH-binding integral membrane protein